MTTRAKPVAKGELRHRHPAWIRFLERRLRHALFGAAPLRTLVAEWHPQAGVGETGRWNPGFVQTETGSTLGIIGTARLVPTASNLVRVFRATADVVGLELPGLAAGASMPSGGEFTLYVDADGPGGRSALEAADVLADGRWYDIAGRPDRGCGPVCTDERDGAHWVDRVPTAYASRFVRFPIACVPTGRRPILRIRVGSAAVRTLIPHLTKRLFVNHGLLGTRVLERIEPDVRNGVRAGAVELQGGHPLLLELVDIRHGHRFYDERYAPSWVDRAFHVRLVSGRGGQNQIRFVGDPVPARYLRLAYWRHLDLDGLEAVPGETTFEWNRVQAATARTVLSPSSAAHPHVAQARRALIDCLTAPHRPRYPSRAELARAVRSAIPGFLRATLPMEPTAHTPLGCDIRFLSFPDADGHAVPTWTIGLTPAVGTDDELESLVPWLETRIAERTGDGIPIVVYITEPEGGHVELVD